MNLLDPRIYVIDKRIKNINKIWAVGSGKGGVGKSTLSTLISLVLNHRGYKVGLLDLDFYGPSSHLILGAEGLKPEEDYGIKPIKINGIEFMSIIYFTDNKPLVMRGKEVSDSLIELLAITCWDNLDFLIIDMPPGMGEILLDILRLINRVEFLIVSTPSKISMETVEKLIRFLKLQGFPILGLIENMKLFPSNFTENRCKEFGINYLGSVSFDEELENNYGNITKLLSSKASTDLSKIFSSLI